MAKKFNPDDTISNIELAEQLRKPSGEVGKKVADYMNVGNKHINLNTYSQLEFREGYHVMELGMGNGYFASTILERKAGMHYTGIDFSETMVRQAKKINAALITSGHVEILQASIESLPCESAIFDCICTTNTLYFWPNPEVNAKELKRVLKPNGQLVIGYRSKDCMEQLEVTKYGFVKYDPIDVEQLLRNAGFTNIATNIITEPSLDFDGKEVSMDGIFTTARG